MDITTKDIIKVLPFDDEFKRSLLEKYDALPPDQRMGIERVLWDLYDAVYNLKLKEKVDIALSPHAGQNVTLDEDFYSRIEAEVDQEMAQESVQVGEQVDLKAARDQLQTLVTAEENHQ